jgi:hypothetical protein
VYFPDSRGSEIRLKIRRATRPSCGERFSAPGYVPDEFKIEENNGFSRKEMSDEQRIEEWRCCPV